MTMHLNKIFTYSILFEHIKVYKTKTFNFFIQILNVSCFLGHPVDNTISLLYKSKISSLLPSSVAVQPGLCWTWLDAPKTGFLAEGLI